MLITEDYARRVVKPALILRMDYQAVPEKKHPTPDNIGSGGTLGGFLLTNRPFIFSMVRLKTITTKA